jgi:hypothetical protein
MKCICVAGVSQPDLEHVVSILEQSGMSAALSVEKQQAMDMSSWHQHVVDMIDEEGELQGFVNPGRFMEQMASDIFLANIKTPLWGWADTRSTLLLDFWQNYDPRVYFVLVCVSPEQLLANAMRSQDENVSVEAVMLQWQQYHQQLLRFYLRNSERSVLVSALDCVQNPSLFVSHITTQWKIKTKLPRLFTLQTPPQKDSHLLFLAQQLCADEVQIQSLQNELSATRLYLDGSLKSQQDSCVYSPEEVLASYVLEQQQIRAKELNTKNKIDEFEKKNDILNNEIIMLTQAYNEKESIVADQQAQINHLIETNTQNSELLLLELHQAHQESENYFLEYQNKEQEFQAQQAQINSLIETNTQNSNSLLRELEQVKQESELYFNLCQEKENESQTHQTAFQNEMASVTQQIHEKESVIANQQAQINRLIETNTQNSELLLLELHQAHQESENYFVLYQEKENALKQAQARWERMLERSPDYFDYDSLNVNITHNGKHKHVSDWTLKNINAAGRTIEAVGFSFEVSKHHTAMCFHQSVDGVSCFVKWPASLTDQSVFKMTFDNNGSVAQQEVDILQALGTSDWRFLGVLAHWLNTTLAKTESANLPRDLPLDALRFGVHQFILLSNQLKSALRYDHVSLKREQTNPDYEHVWLKLSNVVFEDQHAADFEFRLSCANVRPNAFGGYPKLEFPQEATQPYFDSWFEESYDDFGAKLELRFALPDAMDMGIWGKLSAHDQTLVVQLIEQLPIILRELVQSGASMKRPLNDWLKMAQSIEDIFAMRVLPVEVEVVESIDLLALNLYDD